MISKQMVIEKPARSKKVEVWGLAAGHGSTSGAARGAFTHHTYISIQAAKDAVIKGKDWLQILSITEDK
jgi:hypothetical protein